jgi:hypothetical protein
LVVLKAVRSLSARRESRCDKADRAAAVADRLQQALDEIAMHGAVSLPGRPAARRGN